MIKRQNPRKYGKDVEAQVEPSYMEDYLPPDILDSILKRKELKWMLQKPKSA